MSAWVLVLRGIDTDEAGVLEAEARIREVLAEHAVRASTMLEWLYDDQRRGPQLPPVAHVALAVAEHSEPAPNGRLRRRIGHGGVA